MNDINYVCTGASIEDNWEQGERDFLYNFTGVGPFNVSFSGCCWIYLNYGNNRGSWNIETNVNLATRSDIGRPNSSPVTAGQPLYNVRYGSRVVLPIPMVDSDGDTVRCRWSTGNECVDVCNGLPLATLDSETCTLTFNATHTLNGIYAVALSIEDFPKSNIVIGGKLYTPNDPISLVPLQFLINTINFNSSSGDPPVFVNGTLPQGSVIEVKLPSSVTVQFYAYSNQTISRIDLTSPAGMTYSSLQTDFTRPDVYYVTASWTPSTEQIGAHILCATAVDSVGLTSNYHCISLRVSEVSPCDSNPCSNNMTCIRDGANFTCECPAGFTGLYCETDIDECMGDHCENNGTCYDVINGYYCSCLNGFTGLNCESGADACASSPCLNGGICTDYFNGVHCYCPEGTSGPFCEINFNECASSPCENGGYCNDLVNGFTCWCSSGFTGLLCETNINECSSQPCLNGGICSDMVNGYNCRCLNGFTGSRCETIIVSACGSNPCQNGGVCTSVANGFLCSCPVGTSGPRCEINYDDCMNSTCLNNGTCHDLVNGFQCQCQSGYAGARCESELDLCSSDPCSALYECKAGENTGYSCEAGVALYAVVVTSVMTSLGVASFVVFRLLRPSYKVVDHSWLSSYTDVRKPDSQPKHVFNTQNSKKMFA
uniref:Neurogenic locus notch homolog protein 2-like n=1 Tax=Crassostrea virginica TaxID=6565 RepID=A0A8B8DT26_CRAVI|nr:neurogenic locus notch homolog protein 2-like [Crassostrea virginica]